MTGFAYLVDDSDEAVARPLPDAAEPQLETMNPGEIEGLELEMFSSTRGASLPITSRQAERVADWMRRNFGPKLVAASAGTPFTPALLSAIVCQETAYSWISRMESATPASILATCVLDGSGDVAGHPRNVRPRNTAEFRQRFGDAFTELLIDEGNVARRARGLGSWRKIYKGYGLFQYDLQFVFTNEAYFRDRQWHDFDICLARVMGELKEKLAQQHGDLWEAVRAYNGSGAAARRYAVNVRKFHGFCEPVWREAVATG